MKINAFLCLPTEDSILELFADHQEGYYQLVSDLFGIKEQLKGRDFTIYYDSSNVNSFRDGGIVLFADSASKTKRALATLLGITSQDVNLPRFRRHSHYYEVWRQEVPLEWCSLIVPESAESAKHDNASQKTVCVCLGMATGRNKFDLHVVSDSNRYHEPPELISLPLVDSLSAFIRWKKHAEDSEAFSLEHNPKFTPLEKFWGKERIFREIATGNHWYFDYFHKDNKIHYEVFDSTGDVHLGEADDSGKLDLTKSDDRKKISRCL